MTRHHLPIGRKLAPVRFLIFAGLATIAIPVAILLSDWATGLMIGFDLAAMVFLASTAMLFRNSSPASIRKAAAENDANRVLMLVLAVLSGLAILAAVAAELASGGDGPLPPETIALVLSTLAIAWLFGNTVYALHYAHLYYLPGPAGKDWGGIDFPGPGEPDYSDFFYFSFTLGMTFQTSDVDVTSRRIRRIVLLQSLAAFVFNLGIIAFTINVLGGG